MSNHLIKTVNEQGVLANAELIVEAARKFRSLANTLTRELAVGLNVPVENLSDEQGQGSFDTLQPPFEKDWNFDVHGEHCRFENFLTGQTLDVYLGSGMEFGVLDPYFFHQFICTTPEFNQLSIILPNAFHDTWYALDVLEKYGFLQAVVLPNGRRGITADRRPTSETATSASFPGR